MAEASAQAARKPARGGAPNALFVVAPVEALPPELAACAARVIILLPWGSLLAAVAKPDVPVLAGVRQLCQPGASFQAVVSFDPLRDALELVRIGVELPLDPAALASAYARAGFADFRCESLPVAALSELGTTWGRRLGGNGNRPVYRFTATAG